MARHVGHHLCLVVDLVPHHCVTFACGARGSHSEDEAAGPRHLQQLQYLRKDKQEKKGVEREEDERTGAGGRERKGAAGERKGAGGREEVEEERRDRKRKGVGGGRRMSMAQTSLCEYKLSPQ